MMLKCKICGGELRFSSEKYTCLSCGASFSLMQIYENLEVCLCNIESEENGGRTVASHLATEIYTLLEANKIKTYYSRVSSADLFGEDLERTYISAISSSRIIVLVGTKPTEFEALSNKYKPLFEGKIVVPVFKGMDARDLPKNISATQGIDYSRIGASADLVKGILNALGRGDEYDYVVASAKSRKSKRIWLVLAIIALIVVIAAVAVIINITSKGGNTKQETTTTSQTERSQEDIYLSAKTLADEKKYADAITEFSKIVGYKDSQKQINLLYQKYIGYYVDDSNNIDLHLKVSNTNTANIVLTYHAQNNYICKIEVATLLSGTTGSFEFVDSEDNTGTVSFLFTNDGIEFQIKTLEKASDIFFLDSNPTFYLNTKEDALTQDITAEQLIDVVKNATPFSDLDRMGIKVTTNGTTGENGIIDVSYKIANTEIEVILSDWDYRNNRQTETYIIAFVAPSTLVCPEKIGDSALAFSKDGVVYVPTECYYTEEELGNYYFAEEMRFSDVKISEDSKIGIVSKMQIGEHNCNYVMNKNRNSYYLGMFASNCPNRNYFTEYDYESGFFKEIVTQTDDAVLIRVCEHNDYMCVADHYYRMDLSSYQCEFITTVYWGHEDWRDYSEEFGEFITAYVEPKYINVETEGHLIYSQPSYDSDIVVELYIDLWEVIQEYTDENGKLWGRLEASFGWICLSDILES